MGAASVKGVKYQPDGAIDSCIFCDIARNAPGVRQTEVLFEDANMVVFLPREVLANQHFLVVPRKHIQNAATLTPEDMELLDCMMDLGKKIMAQRAPHANEDSTQYVFHVPPFNSIDHLHLHCQAQPFVSPWAAIKYRAGTRWCMTIDEIKSKLLQQRPKA